jgi:hypothetical protein
MLHESVFEAIALELDRLNELLEKYAPLLQKSKIQEPDFIEMASLSVLLHAFYSGLENISLPASHAKLMASFPAASIGIRTCSPKCSEKLLFANSCCECSNSN